MEELKFEAPLAQFESEDFVDLVSDLQNLQSGGNKLSTNANNNVNGGGGLSAAAAAAKGLEHLMKKALQDEENNDVVVVEGGDGNFTDTFSGSLEDLVNTFDEKITKCFNNLDETTDKLAPVQMRSQEELMNDCQ
jgi:hypothetical protein